MNLLTEIFASYLWYKIADMILYHWMINFCQNILLSHTLMIMIVFVIVVSSVVNAQWFWISMRNNFSEDHKILMQASDKCLAFSRGSKWARNCCSLFFTISRRQSLDIQEEKNYFPCGLSKRSLFSVRQNYFAFLLLLMHF